MKIFFSLIAFLAVVLTNATADDDNIRARDKGGRKVVEFIDSKTKAVFKTIDVTSEKRELKITKNNYKRLANNTNLSNSADLIEGFRIRINKVIIQSKSYEYQIRNNYIYIERSIWHNTKELMHTRYNDSWGEYTNIDFFNNTGIKILSVTDGRSNSGFLSNTGRYLGYETIDNKIIKIYDTIEKTYTEFERGRNPLYFMSKNDIYWFFRDDAFYKTEGKEEYIREFSIYDMANKKWILVKHRYKTIYSPHISGDIMDEEKRMLIIPQYTYKKGSRVDADPVPVRVDTIRF